MKSSKMEKDEKQQHAPFLIKKKNHAREIKKGCVECPSLNELRVGRVCDAESV